MIRICNFLIGLARFQARSIVAVTFLVLAFAVSTAAQVTVAPTTMYLSDNQRFGSMFVHNTTDTPQEVTVNFRFGYPVTDSTGQISFTYQDPQAAEQYSASDWLESYPQRFILPPQQRQRIRIAIRPPGNLPDRMYWSRVAVTATQKADEPQASAASGVRTNITYRFRQITSLFYQRGNLDTGVNVRVATQRDSQHVQFRARAERTGNAPFLGQAVLEVTPTDGGDPVFQERQRTSVYFEMLHTFAVPLTDLSPGEYKAEVRFVTQRTDIPSSQLLTISPVTKTIRFTVEDNTE